MKLLRSLLLALLALLTIPSQAALISLIPSDIDIFVGESFNVEVQISDLQPDEVVALFDLTILFDPAVFSLTGSAFGLGLGGIDDSIQDNNGNNFYESSFLDDVSLESLQGSAFTLFTLSFQAIAPNLISNISLEINPFGLLDYNQLNIQADINPAAVTVQPRAQTVPAPATSTLLLLAVTGLLTSRRRTRFYG